MRDEGTIIQSWMGYARFFKVSSSETAKKRLQAILGLESIPIEAPILRVEYLEKKKLDYQEALVSGLIPKHISNHKKITPDRPKNESRVVQDDSYVQESYCEQFKITSGSVGSISELIVCADLLKMGYHVFRSVSPNGPVDLMAFKGKSTLKVEVKTSRRNASGKVLQPNHNHNEHDVMAVYLPEEKIVIINAA